MVIQQEVVVALKKVVQLFTWPKESRLSQNDRIVAAIYLKERVFVFNWCTTNKNKQNYKDKR